MLVLGIDPGSIYTGYGLVEKTGSDVRYVASGRINAASAGEFVARLEVIYSGVRQILREFEPEYAAVESIFFARNAMSSLKLGHARGVALLAVQHAALELAEYPPATVKQAVTGHGRADKDQVAQMVKLTLQIEGELAEDASDALAVAICHCLQADYLRRIG